ncbi:MAG: amino acid ABC transporter substrate-binding protein [Acidobacteria bacterium]|nr:MAG: amino acid ABC transporter substrate-binding protein [Acidobacteriota bacterium]
MKMRVYVITAVVALVACVVSTAYSQAPPIDIGAILPLTGDGGSYGPGMQLAMQVAVDEVNKAGGPQFRLRVEDDATTPDQGVRAAHKLIDVNHVKAIVGTWASSVTLAVAPLTQAADIVEMNVSGSPKLSTLQPVGQRTVFRVNATDEALAAAVAKTLYRQGFKSVTILSNNAAGTIGLGENFKDSFTKNGGTVLSMIVYPDKQSSYTSEVGKALATKPDLYLLSCYTPDGILVVKEAYQGHATAKFAMPAWCLNDDLIKGVGANVADGDIAFDLVAVSTSKAYKRLNAAYNAKTGKDAFDNVYAVHVYDAIHLLALAFQKAGTTKSLVVGKALIQVSNPPGQEITSFAEGLPLLRQGKSVHYVGASGPIEFNAQGDMAPNVGIFKVENGKMVLKTGSQ